MVCMSRASLLSMAATCLASWSILDSSTPNRASSPAGKGGCGGEAPPAGLHDTGSVTLELDCAEARGAVAAGSEDSLVDATDGGAPDASCLGDQPGLLRLDRLILGDTPRPAADDLWRSSHARPGLSDR